MDDPLGVLEFVRFLNVLIACIALGLNVEKMIHYKLWRYIETDAMYRWMSLFGVLAAYIVSTILAIFADVPTGAWTVVWTPPLAWAAISGFIDRSEDKQPSKKP